MVVIQYVCHNVFNSILLQGEVDVAEVSKSPESLETPQPDQQSSKTSQEEQPSSPERQNLSMFKSSPFKASKEPAKEKKNNKKDKKEQKKSKKEEKGMWCNEKWFDGLWILSVKMAILDFQWGKAFSGAKLSNMSFYSSCN